MLDEGNNRIQKFGSNGAFIKKFGTIGTDNGQFSYPDGIAVDNSGNIFVADTANHRIQKFNNSGLYLSQFGTKGSVSGQFSHPYGVAVDSSGNIFVADTWNYRIQKWTEASPSSFDKAIIVAGGGNHFANALWNATQKNAELAYQTLEFQGYNSENIYYLSSDRNFTSPADGFASKKNLQDAVTIWASNADNLLIYMVDHGGNGIFVMNESEILSIAGELDVWLDNLQQPFPGNIILIYDACKSGSMIGRLNPPAGKKRIVVASSSADEPAVFASEGTYSFSWNFWSQIYGGVSFHQAFLNAQNTMEISRSQHCLIDADGNGIPGEKADSEIAATIRIGNGTASGADFPLIGSVSASPQKLTDTTSALIYAENVIASDGIRKVWAVITPPKNIICYSAEVPITSFPKTELKPVGNNRYETTYTDFTSKGTYQIAVFATDNKDFTSIWDLQKHIAYVTQTQDFSPPVKKGDISGDNQVNLTDVISALQISAGLNPSQSRCDYAASGADVNGDNRVGLEEVIYILQVVAGLK